MSLLKKLVLVTLVALVSLASLLLYIQTRHGFRHVVVPLVAKLTGARLEVRDGLLSLLGALEVDGVVYEDPDSGISFDAERLVLRATPWSFIEDGVPRIDELELKRANLRTVYRPAPAGEPVREPDAESGGTFMLLPVAVERARFDDVTVTVDEGHRRMTGHVTAELNHLGPGRAGNLALQTGFLMEPGDGTPDLSGAIDLALSLEVGSKGTLIKWNGSNRALVRTGRGPLESTDPEVLTFEQTLTGEYEHAVQNLRVASHVAIRRAGAQLGTAELTVATEGVKRPTVTDASLTMTEVTGDTVNLWLDKTAAAHVHAGRFDAQVEVHVEGTRTTIRGKATGSGVRLRSGDREASPPVDVALHHVGSFDLSTRDVAIETLTLTIGDRAKTLLSGALDRPVSLHFDRPEGATSSAGADTAPAVWSLQLTPSEIRELRPWLALLGSDPLKDVSAGRLGGALIVTMYEQGKLVDVAGRLEGTDVMLRGQGSGRTAFMGPLGIVADWKSRLADLQLLKLDPLTASVKLKGKQVATLHATGAGRFGEATELTALNGTLQLTALPGETLNPLLALWSQTRIGRAQIDGHADITVDEGHARWQVDVRGQGLHLQLQDTSSDAPPLDLQINQRGEFDRKVQTLRLDQLNVQVVEGRRSVATLSLDQPLTLNLTQGKEGSGSKAGGSSEPITLGLRVISLGIPQLRPWIALAGSQALSSVRGGALDADLKVRLSGIDNVAFVGRLDLEQVTFERSKMHANAPVTLGTEVRASITGRSHVNVDSWALRALDGKRLLAQARLTGSADSVGATDLALDVAASDLSEFVDRLGLLTERQRGLISGGNLTGKVQLVTAGPQKPLSVKGALHSVNLNIRLDKTHQMTRSLGLQAEVEVDAARSLAEIQRLEFAVESGGAKAGTLTVSGRWPLPAAGATTRAGAVNLTVNEWDTAPFVDFFAILPGRGPGPLPLTGEIKFIQEAGGLTLAVQGKETIGPVSITANGGNPESTTVHLEHDVVRNGDEIKVAALSLLAERPKGRADRVEVNGNIRTGPRPRLQLRGSVDALNADWYTSLTASPSDQAPNGKTSGEPQDAKDKGAGLAVPLNLDVDLTIGAVIYRTLEIGKGRLIAKGDGERMKAAMEPTGLAGGSVQGTVTIALRGGQPEFGWDAKGDTLDLGVLTKAAFAEPEPRVTGRGKFTTSGKGRGQGEALRQSLDGTIVFDVADGQFVKSPVLEFLAEQTHIKEFSGLGFRTLHGELQLKDGWVHLNQVRADGPSVAVEAGGKVGLDGQFDARVQPKIGPGLSDHVRIPCLDKFTKTADGFVVLPVAVTVKGTAENPIYGAEVTAGSIFGRQAGNLVGTIADVLSGCRDGDATQKSTEEAVGAIKEQAESLIKGLLGGKKK
jgi:phage baseplate assembly protein gpV